jgi:hypothetical protein
VRTSTGSDSLASWLRSGSESDHQDHTVHIINYALHIITVELGDTMAARALPMTMGQVCRARSQFVRARSQFV